MNSNEFSEVSVRSYAGVENEKREYKRTFGNSEYAVTRNQTIRKELEETRRKGYPLDVYRKRTYYFSPKGRRDLGQTKKR
jgi:hypothetical protein